MLPTTQKKESVLLRYYEKFEPLARKYAFKIYQAEKIGFEFEDLVQEFKIKIYTSILAYGNYYQRYKERGLYKPWPIEMYVRRSLDNKYKDFIKSINQADYKTISIEQDGFDYSLLHSMESHIIINERVCECEINGVNLLEGLTDIEGRCFMMFLKGYTISKLQKIFKNLFHAAEMIKKQVALLQTKEKELLHDTVRHLMSFSTESDN